FSPKGINFLLLMIRIKDFVKRKMRPCATMVGSYQMQYQVLHFVAKIVQPCPVRSIRKHIQRRAKLVAIGTDIKMPPTRTVIRLSRLGVVVLWIGVPDAALP